MSFGGSAPRGRVGGGRCVGLPTCSVRACNENFASGAAGALLLAMGKRAVLSGRPCFARSKGARGCRVLTWSVCGVQGAPLVVGSGPAPQAERPRQRPPRLVGSEPLALPLHPQAEDSRVFFEIAPRRRLTYTKVL